MFGIVETLAAIAAGVAAVIGLIWRADRKATRREREEAAARDKGAYNDTRKRIDAADSGASDDEWLRKMAERNKRR